MTAPAIDIDSIDTPTMSVTQAANLLGIGEKLAYELIKRDEFPARVLRLGRLLRVTTASVRAALDLDEE